MAAAEAGNRAPERVARNEVTKLFTISLNFKMFTAFGRQRSVDAWVGLETPEQAPALRLAPGRPRRGTARKLFPSGSKPVLEPSERLP
jgi:hypothetical protein